MTLFKLLQITPTECLVAFMIVFFTLAIPIVGTYIGTDRDMECYPELFDDDT